MKIDFQSEPQAFLYYLTLLELHGNFTVTSRHFTDAVFCIGDQQCCTKGATKCTDKIYTIDDGVKS